MASPRVTDTGLLLGVDVGSSRTKVMLVDVARGTEVGTISAAGPFTARGGRSEASVDSLLDVVGRTLRRAVGSAAGRVVGVGVAGVAESGAPTDADGRALAPVIAWHDPRGDATAARLRQAFGRELDRSLGQRLRYVATVAKLGWLVEHGLPPPARWLGVPELVLRALTGAEATEWSLAARTGCFDVGRRAWLPEVAAAAGFDVDVFPPVMAAGEVMGRVTADGAAWSGLPIGVPVTVAGHDHLVGFVGSGAGPDDLGDSVGTAETVVGRSPGFPGALPGLAVGPFPGDDGWAVMTSAARAGQAMAETATALGRTPSELDRLAEGADLLDAPGLVESLRRREPPVLPDGSLGAVWATLLDALATETAAAADRVTAAAALGPRRRLVVFGGGSVSRPLLAAKARRVPIPVERAPVVDAVARGAALLAPANW